MQITITEELVAELLNLPDIRGNLYGIRRDNEDLLQVRGTGPNSGIYLGWWVRGELECNLEFNELVLLLSLDTPNKVRTLVGTLEGPVEVSCEIVRLKQDYFSRHQGLFETDRLLRAKIAIVGVGSGGSTVAMHLARSGVGTLHLIDRGRLRTNNVIRHVCNLEDIGRHKTHAVADLLNRVSPVITVRTSETDILEDPNTLGEAISECDLVIGATDSEQSKLLINQICWEIGKPAVYGAAYNRAFGGDIFRALPSAGACYACFHSALSEMFDPPPTEADDFSPGYSDPSRMGDLVAAPGLGLDVTMIALLVARVALDVLLHDEPLNLAHLPGNLLFFGNRAEWIFQKPLESLFVEIPRQEGCRVCNDRSRASISPVATAAEAAHILAQADALGSLRNRGGNEE